MLLYVSCLTAKESNVWCSHRSSLAVASSTALHESSACVFRRHFNIRAGQNPLRFRPVALRHFTRRRSGSLSSPPPLPPPPETMPRS